jgi:DNA-directed RNA polymerase specialized sigma24 family protein
LPEYDPDCGVILHIGRCFAAAARLKEAHLATFAKNVEATIPALRRYARALTRDSDIADDLVQDTLVRALRSEHLFHGEEVRSWLYTILTNLNRNRLRSLARRPPMSSIAAARRAGRLELPRSRRSARRADWHRDVASGACARSNQNLSRERAPCASPREMTEKVDP